MYAANTGDLFDIQNTRDLFGTSDAGDFMYASNTGNLFDTSNTGDLFGTSDARNFMYVCQYKRLNRYNKQQRLIWYI